MLKTKVLWKREGNRVCIASPEGIYLLNQKASFIWGLVGEKREDEIIGLYERRFAAKEEGEVSRFIDELKALALVEV